MPKYQIEYLFYDDLRRNSDRQWEIDAGPNVKADDNEAIHWFEGFRPTAAFAYRLVAVEGEAPNIERHVIACKTAEQTLPANRELFTEDIFQRGCIMPAAPTPTPLPASAINPAERMVHVAVKRDTTNGSRLFLYVDAKKLHETLTSLGVPKTGTRFDNRPASRQSVADASFNLSTEVFLNAEYPAKYDLSAVFANPPSLANLKKLCNSSFEAVRKILEHYQPIDISVEIQKKAVR